MQLEQAVSVFKKGRILHSVTRIPSYREEQPYCMTVWDLPAGKIGLGYR